MVLQTHMRSPYFGYRHAVFAFLPQGLYYMKALARLPLCTGSPEHLLVAYVISALFSCAGSNGKIRTLLLSMHSDTQTLYAFLFKWNIWSVIPQFGLSVRLCLCILSIKFWYCFLKHFLKLWVKRMIPTSMMLLFCMNFKLSIFPIVGFNNMSKWKTIMSTISDFSLLTDERIHIKVRTLLSERFCLFLWRETSLPEKEFSYLLHVLLKMGLGGWDDTLKHSG